MLTKNCGMTTSHVPNRMLPAPSIGNIGLGSPSVFSRVKYLKSENNPGMMKQIPIVITK